MKMDEARFGDGTVRTEPPLEGDRAQRKLERSRVGRPRQMNGNARSKTDLSESRRPTLKSKVPAGIDERLHR